MGVLAREEGWFKRKVPEVIYTIILLISVGVRKLQVAILARSSREMYLTVRIVRQYILSRVRASVRPSMFYTRKTSINYREGPLSRKFLLNEKGRNTGLAGDRLAVSDKNTSGQCGHSSDRLSQHG